jgi:hypothetical protein
MERKTLLERYRATRLGYDESFKDVMPGPNQIWLYQELLYRIGTLEVFQLFSKAAPFTDDLKTLGPHYQAVNTYVGNLTKERYIPSPNPERQKQEQTALIGFQSVVMDYRKQYASYSPKGIEQYQKDIARTIATVLPAWIQFRNAIIEIKLEEAAA